MALLFAMWVSVRMRTDRISHHISCIYSLGLNSILIYMGHEVFQLYFPFSWKGIEVNHAIFLLSNEIGVSVWIAIAFYCHCMKFYIKI